MKIIGYYEKDFKHFISQDKDPKVLEVYRLLMTQPLLGIYVSLVCVVEQRDIRYLLYVWFGVRVFFESIVFNILRPFRARKQKCEDADLV